MLTLSEVRHITCHWILSNVIQWAVNLRSKSAMISKRKFVLYERYVPGNIH